MNGIFESIGLLIFRILFGISLIPHSFPKLNRDSNIQLKEYMAQIGIPTIFVDLSMLIIIWCEFRKGGEWEMNSGV